MADFQSKYSGEQVEALLDIVKQGGTGGGGGEGEVQKTTEAEITAMGFTKNLGTITEIKMNGVSKGTSGVVDLGSVITSHQDISGLASKSEVEAIADELENLREEVATTEQLEQLNETVTGNYDEFVNAIDELSPIAINFDFADVINNPSGIEIPDEEYTSLIFGIIDRKQMFAKYNGKQIPIVAYSEETNPVNLHIHAMYGDTNVLYATVGNSRIMKGGITPGGGGGGITIETDPVFSASPAASITTEKMSSWDGKQDAIPDLEAIRSGAEKGATALQTVPSEYVTQTELEGKLEELGIGRTVKHTSDEQEVTIEPNTFHVWDSVYMLYVTLGEAKEGEKSEYLFQFTAGVWLDECLIDAPFPLRFDTSLEWKYGHTYLVHIVNGNGTVYEYEPYVPEDEIWFYTDGTLIAPNLSNLSDKYGPIAYTYDAYAGKHILKIEGAWISEIPDSTFADSNLWSVMLPSAGVRIGDYAFSDCENLQNIYTPFIRGIGNEAFRDSPIGLTIDLTYCENIGEGAFEGTSVHEIIIPQSITTIPVNCFYGCQYLSKVKLPEGLKVIGSSAFGYCSNLEDVTIPSTVESIGAAAFSECTRLKKIEVPSGVLELLGHCFTGCTSLEEVIWHEGKSGVDARSIYPEVFSGCTNLRKVTIPEGVADIQNGAFAHTAISTLVLPSTVTDIGSYSFDQMPNLQTIYCKAPRPPYVDSGFMMQVSSTIYVPEGVVENYKSANGWSEFANAIVGYNFAGPWNANLTNYYDKRELPEPAAYVLNTEQTLTEEQKEQARKNIGAASTSYIISVFEEIKALIKNGDYDKVVAVLDKAILDFATLG